jgi:hypothetical protein
MLVSVAKALNDKTWMLLRSRMVCIVGWGGLCMASTLKGQTGFVNKGWRGRGGF